MQEGRDSLSDAEMIDHIRRFVEEIMESSYFESWVYKTPELEKLLPGDLFLDVLSCDYRHSTSISRLQRKLKAWARVRFPYGYPKVSPAEPIVLPHITSEISADLANSGADAGTIRRIFDEYSADTARLRSDCEKALKEKDEAIKAILEEKTQGFPWLADALAKYQALADEQYVHALLGKHPPAVVTAERLKEVAEERRRHQREARILRSRLEYFESLFPWLSEYVGADIDTLLAESSEVDTEDELDRAAIYLSPEEFTSLPTVQKYQFALDRYWQRRKSDWEIGRDYERFIGYLYEQQGFEVTYFGIDRGLGDLGRDLICRNQDVVLTVQCKCWSANKTLREKHIAQLFGTTVLHNLALKKCDKLPPAQRVQEGGVMVTTTVLSDTAREFASILGIKCYEHLKLERYPCIKLNPMGYDGERIYHLPFDQKYDHVVMGKHGRSYVTTVAEAENLGFRRARRWHPERES